jgi:hypothetical protein
MNPRLVPQGSIWQGLARRCSVPLWLPAVVFGSALWIAVALALEIVHAIVLAAGGD